ncbi:MAG: hypothetical protein IJM18_03535 [Clostridia bacterium]|nr:hypothetical protein [Clostridia bacterium]
MKRTLALLIVVIMLAAAFAACTKPKVEGTYKIKTIDGKTPYEYFKSKADAEGLDVGMLLTLMGISEETLNNFMEVKLEKDGKAVVKIMGEEPESCTWELKDSKTVTFKSGDETSEAEYKNGTLTMTEDGMTCVLEKVD